MITNLRDEAEAHRLAWDTRGRLSDGERALQTHLIDFKPERGLTGPGSARIDELIPHAQFTEYLKVPGLSKLHAVMGVDPTLKTDPHAYTSSRYAVFAKQPVQDVPFSKLTYTQPRINTARVNELSTVTKQLDQPVHIIKSGDRYYLMNGHHRVGGSHVAGRTTVKGHVFDADGVHLSLSYRDRLSLVEEFGAAVLLDHDAAVKAWETRKANEWADKFVIDDATARYTVKEARKGMRLSETLDLERDEDAAHKKQWDTIGRKGDSSNTDQDHIHEEFKKSDPKRWTQDSHSTLKFYRNDEKRSFFHQKIIEDATRAIPATAFPVAYFMGGGPGAGKTSLLKSGLVDVPDRHSAVYSNPDDVKELLPEFHIGKNAGNKLASSVVHEESSAVAKRIATTGLRQSKNTVIDNVGDSGIDALRERINNLRADGAKRVVGHYVTCDTSEALLRAEHRAKTEGRAVPPNVVTEAHRDVTRTFLKASHAGIFDEISLYDNNELGKPPKLVASGNKKTFNIHDKVAWARFAKKANE